MTAKNTNSTIDATATETEDLADKAGAKIGQAGAKVAEVAAEAGSAHGKFAEMGEEGGHRTKR